MTLKLSEKILECCICTEDIRETTSNKDKENIIFVTICNHNFHKSCLLKWTDMSHRIEDVHCPLCRTKLLDDNTKNMFQSRPDAKYNNINSNNWRIINNNLIDASRIPFGIPVISTMSYNTDFDGDEINIFTGPLNYDTVRGRRIYVNIETPNNHRINIQRMRELSGGDSIHTRHILAQNGRRIHQTICRINRNIINYRRLVEIRDIFNNERRVIVPSQNINNDSNNIVTVGISEGEANVGIVTNLFSLHLQRQRRLRECLNDIASPIVRATNLI